MAHSNVYLPLTVLCLVLAACAGSTALPTDKPFFPSPRSSEVYAGEGTAYAWHDGAWVEAPKYDYEFMVIKRIYDGSWNVVKQLYRLHPDYSGLAGPREQTLFFDVRYQTADNGYALKMRGTLGVGNGWTSSDMSDSSVELTPEGSGFLRPFNQVRITQHLDRASGMMKETVELLKIKDGNERPFMKFEEHGTLYLPPQAR
jgi:hypothetical protein